MIPIINTNQLASVLLPIILSPITYLIGRKWKKLTGVFAFLILLISGLLLFTEVPAVLERGITTEAYHWIQPFNLKFGLRSDGLSLPIGLAILFLSSLSALASVSYMEEKHDHGAYYLCLMLFASGMLGVVLAINLLEFYLFWELMIIPSYFLIAYWGYKDSQRIGLKYFLWTRAGGLSLLFGILWLYSMTGTFNIYQIQGTVRALPWVSLLFLIAFFIKMAVFPLHNWLPDAHSEAPAPISAMLSGVMIKVGAYGIVRILLQMLSVTLPYLFWFLVLAVVTMVYGGLMALIQDDVKRLLAFSSISQMGYILFGLLIANQLGMLGGLFHIVNHAIAKGLLFLCSAALVCQVGTRKMGELGGLASKMPVTTIAMILGALSIAGTPPLNGFISELLIFGGGISARCYWLTAGAVLTSILTLGYYLWAIKRIFFGKTPKKFKNVEETSLYLTIPLILLSLATILLGIWPEPVLRLISVFVR